MQPGKQTYLKAIVLFSVMAILAGFSLMSPGTASAQVWQIQSCADCHNDPPDDATAGQRGVPAGAVAGSHGAHIAAGAACSDCHNEPTRTPTPDYAHSDGTINVLVGVGYGLGSPAQRSDVTLATLESCSTASCHNDGTGQIASDTWGTIITDCTECHGQPPATGKHNKHFNLTMTTNNPITDCDTCHVKPASADLSGADGHLDGTLPAENHCNTAQCHGTGLADATKATVTTVDWANGPLTADCTWCHGNPPTSAAGFNHSGWTLPACATCHGHDGSGSGHLELDANIDDVTTCTTCHDQPPSGTSYPDTNNSHGKHFALTMAPSTLITDCTNANCHVKPAQTVTANHPNATVEQNCSTTQCHNSALVSGGSNTSPTWGTGTANCGWCHQNGTTIPEHSYPGLVTSDCKVCHTHDGTNIGGSVLADHLNGTVTFPNATCTSCHATPPPSGKHVKHLSGLTMIPNTIITDCDSANCHVKPTQMNHADGSVVQNCSTAQCHNRGLADATKANVTVADWNGAPSADCTWCHGNPPMSVPDHTGQAATACTVCHTHDGTGNPADHISGTVTLNGTVSCTTCHAQPPNGASAPNTASSHTQHFGTTMTSAVAWDCTTASCHVKPGSTDFTHADGVTAQSCDNTQCHNSAAVTASAKANININPNPTWGSGPATCEWCHDNPPYSSTKYDHVGESAGTCTPCHPHSGTGSPADHINGSIQESSSTSCDGCHNYTEAQWAAAVGTSKYAIESVGAHAKHIAEIKDRRSITGALDPAQGNTDGFGLGQNLAVCGVCHTNVEGQHKSGDRLVNFGDGSNEFQFGPAASPGYTGVVGSGSATDPKTCTNVSCHYSETPVWAQPQ